MGIDAREQRGMVIAETCTIRQEGKLWRVPSQSGNGTYSVSLSRTFCTCPDHTDTGLVCKHIHAARITVSRSVIDSDGTTTTETLTVERKTYKQDWPNYNRAQVNEHRHFQSFLADICGTLPVPAPKPGRPAILPSDAAFCAVYKVYSTMSARRFMGDLDEAKDGGYVSRIPHFNSVLNFFDREDSTTILADFVTKSAAPLVAVESAFATDSTGFAGARYLRWFDEKYGKPKSEVAWLKLHATVGVKTNVVTACKITEKEGADTGDAKQFKELTEKTAEQFTIKEMSADKAYASRDNCDTMEKIGGQFYPAFRKNTTGEVGGSFKKVFHLMKANEEDYAKHYHLRSNVESTFSAMKRKFGEDLRSKTTLAMTNEILAKVICHNLSCVVHAMYELGIDPDFVVKPRCTNTPKPAQLLAAKGE